MALGLDSWTDTQRATERGRCPLVWNRFGGHLGLQISALVRYKALIVRSCRSVLHTPTLCDSRDALHASAAVEDLELAATRRAQNSQGFMSSFNLCASALSRLRPLEQLSSLSAVALDGPARWLALSDAALPQHSGRHSLLASINAGKPVAESLSSAASCSDHIQQRQRQMQWLTSASLCLLSECFNSPTLIST
jgi:hypothetical protein